MENDRNPLIIYLSKYWKS